MSQLIDRPIIQKDGQKPRSEPATADEKLRYEMLKAMPCQACRKIGQYGACGPTEIHHLTDGGRRMGNLFSIPLGSWHHRAQIPVGFGLKNTTEAVAMFGPSLETSKRDFEERFGTELQLLAETNKLLGPKFTSEGAK